MKTQIVYALLASPQDYFLEEIWSSVYSLRLYDTERVVRVCCDLPTAEYVRSCKPFMKLITELVVIDVPENYNTKLRSREIKTTVRLHVKGDMLFVDTDTIFCGPIDEIDVLTYEIAAVREYHLPLSKSPYRHLVVDNIKKTFNVDVSMDDGWHNSGVIFVADTERTHEFYRQWNENWRYSALERNMSQDEPALMKTDKDFGYIMEELPDVYNCQPAMSVKYLADAKIIHFLHMHFPQDQSFCSFINKSFYRRIHDEAGITLELAQIIRNAKQSFTSPSCVVGWKTMNFMASPVFSILENIYNEGGATSWLMQRLAQCLNKLQKCTRKTND